MSKKVLFLAAHLSTGGMPQYLFLKIDKFLKKSNYEVYLIEFSDIAPIYRVQKDKIRNLLDEDHFITLEGDDESKKRRLLYEINRIKPDIIHLEEVPEMWLPYDITKEIYSKHRTYKIIETSHDSGFEPNKKVFLPDAFAFISEYHPKIYKDFDVPYSIVEYPIEHKERPDRTEALKLLGLDSDYFHVLNVGLFTPRKNQKEIFELANKLVDYKVKFHFVGNQADNFKHYWQPLMRNKPDNCVIWGERSDVDSFYSACDLFLFTSRGTDNDRETNPLVLKEALAWDMKILMYNLDVYCGMYDRNKNISFLSGNLGEDARKVIDVLQI